LIAARAAKDAMVTKLRDGESTCAAACHSPFLGLCWNRNRFGELSRQGATCRAIPFRSRASRAEMNLLLLAVLDPDFMDLSRLFTSVAFVFHVLFRPFHNSQASDDGDVLFEKRTSLSTSF
jgi:hypothetical protein